jgi:hypothetical protein
VKAEARRLLLLHISNRALNLEPVARGLAEHLGWRASAFVSGEDYNTARAARTAYSSPAITSFSNTAGSDMATPLDQSRAHHLADDFSSLWHILKF